MDTKTVFHNVVFVTVLSDEALPHVLDAGVCVQHIVHYDLPSTKAEFRSRLALFYTAMKWYVMLNTGDGVIEVSLSVFIGVCCIIDRSHLPKNRPRCYVKSPTVHAYHRSGNFSCYEIFVV